MGTPGTGVIGSDGRIKLFSDGRVATFDASGESCCCGPPPYPCDQSSELEESYSVEFDDLPFNFDWLDYPPEIVESGGVVDFDTNLRGPSTGGGSAKFGFPGRSNVDADPDWVIPQSKILHSEFEGLTILSCSDANAAGDWVRLANFPASANSPIFTLSYNSTRPGEVDIGNNDYFGVFLVAVGTQSRFPLPVQLTKSSVYTVDASGQYFRQVLYHINGVLRYYSGIGPTGYTVDDPPCPMRHNGITFGQVLGGFFGSDLCSWKLRRPVWGYNTSDGSPSLRYDPAGSGGAHWNYNIGEAISYSPIVLNLVGQLKFSLASGVLPIGTRVDGSTGLVIGNPVSVGGGEASVKAVDANGDEAVSPVYTWAGTIVDIPDPDPDPDPLALSYPSPFTNSATSPTIPKDWRLENGGATITPTASGGVEPYSFGATGLPPGCSILPSGGEIILSAGHNQVTTTTGTCEITLTDDDGTPIVVSYDWERIGSGGP